MLDINQPLELQSRNGAFELKIVDPDFNGMWCCVYSTMAGQKFSVIVNPENGDAISHSCGFAGRVENKPTPHIHAEIIKKWADNPNVRLKSRRNGNLEWRAITNGDTIGWFTNYEYEEILPGDPLY